MKASEGIIARVKIKDMKPFPDVAPVIKKLHKNHCLIVVSSNDSPSIKEALKHFHYDKYFQDILGSDFMFSKKEKILYAAKNIILRSKTFTISETPPAISRKVSRPASKRSA